MMSGKNGYKSLVQFRKEKIRGREEIYEIAVKILKGLEPVAVHQFGSGGKGTSDEFSDLDFFVTLRDEDFEKKIKAREEYYSSVAPILLRLFEKLPNPVGWFHDLIIYETDKGLFQVDYYLTPRSKVILPPDSKLIEGEDNLPTGVCTVENKTDTAGHDLYEAILAMTYIGVKGIVRKWNSEFFKFLRTLYNSYRRDENPSEPELPEENNFNLINSILVNLQLEGNKRQQKANKMIQEYTSNVKQ